MKGPRRPGTPIPGLPETTLGDFWAWAYGNLLENTVRPAFAEFVVGALLGVESDGRRGWDAVDLRWLDARIEVKSSAYVQAWPQKRPSAIQFDIARKRPWDALTNVSGAEPVRSADCYVFCLYPERDPARADPLDVAAWRFWVLPTTQIEATFGDQKSVSLSRLEAQADPVDAAGLPAAVYSALPPRLIWGAPHGERTWATLTARAGRLYATGAVGWGDLVSRVYADPSLLNVLRGVRLAEDSSARAALWSALAGLPTPRRASLVAEVYAHVTANEALPALCAGLPDGDLLREALRRSRRGDLRHRDVPFPPQAPAEVIEAARRWRPPEGSRPTGAPLAADPALGG